MSTPVIKPSLRFSFFCAFFVSKGNRLDCFLISDSCYLYNFQIPCSGMHKEYNYILVMAKLLQSNLNSSNTDGSFTMANSNSVLSPYEILPIDQENKYLRKVSYFIMKLYVLCTH